MYVYVHTYVHIYIYIYVAATFLLIWTFSARPLLVVWAVVLGLPFLEGGQEGRHGLCSSDLEKWRSVVMVTTIPLPE